MSENELHVTTCMSLIDRLGEQVKHHIKEHMLYNLIYIKLTTGKAYLYERGQDSAYLPRGDNDEEVTGDTLWKAVMLYFLIYVIAAWVYSLC